MLCGLGAFLCLSSIIFSLDDESLGNWGVLIPLYLLQVRTTGYILLATYYWLLTTGYLLLPQRLPTRRCTLFFPLVIT